MSPGFEEWEDRQLRWRTAHESARWHASRGVMVFPLTAERRLVPPCRACRRMACGSPPLCDCGSGRCHGPLAATTSEEVIGSWFRTDENRNFAVATGACSNLVVLEVDALCGGMGSLAALQAQGWDMNDCAVRTTFGAGRFMSFYMAHPGGFVPYSRGRLGPGLNVLGDRGWAVAAPCPDKAETSGTSLDGDLVGLPVFPDWAAHPDLTVWTPGGLPGLLESYKSVPSFLFQMWAEHLRRTPQNNRAAELERAARALAARGGSYLARVRLGACLVNLSHEVDIPFEDAWSAIKAGISMPEWEPVPDALASGTPAQGDPDA